MEPSDDGPIPYEFDLTRPIPPHMPPLILSVDPLVIDEEPNAASQENAPWDNFLDACSPVKERLSEGRRSSLVTIVSNTEYSVPNADSGVKQHEFPLSQQFLSQRAARSSQRDEIGTDDDEDVVCLTLPETQARTQDNDNAATKTRKRRSVTVIGALDGVMNDPIFDSE